MKKPLWIDLGSPGELIGGGPMEQWQDHGLGLMRTILHRAGVETDLLSVRARNTWNEVATGMLGYETILMNVRSYRLLPARKVARMFKIANPRGKVIVGGMHATVSPHEMEESEDFDYICQGAAEETIVDLVKDPTGFQRVFKGKGSKSMADWPFIDRSLWPNTPNVYLQLYRTWPLEPSCGWGPNPVATVMTDRVCPWACTFCNEASYIPQITRRTVDQVIEELNYLDKAHGPLGSVIIHDSMFFQSPRWLEEWLEKYPKKANKTWPYWAAGRADTVRQWPDLFEALVRETNWRTVSIGFESGSTRVLKMLNKECTAEDNYFTIDLLNKIGDDMLSKGQVAPSFWSNIMFAIPGETREDAFATVRMMRHTKRLIPSIAYYAPFPGSVLGEQIIAEGKSLLEEGDNQRYAGQPKVKGVDYRFYDDLLAGHYNKAIEQGQDARG